MDFYICHCSINKKGKKRWYVFRLGGERIWYAKAHTKWGAERKKKKLEAKFSNGHWSPFQGWIE